MSTKTTASQLIYLIVFACSVCANLEDWCKQTKGNKHKLDLPNLYKLGVEGGKGKNGTVKYVNPDSQQWPQGLIIKEITPRDQKKKLHFVETEIAALKAMEKYDNTPHFVACSTAESDSGDIFYIAMTFVSGVNLSDPKFLKKVFKEGPQAMDKWMQIFRAIQNLYENDYVHGDISLENVRYNDDNNKMYLIDFDAAEPINQTPVERIGSQGYMSPKKILMYKTDIMDDVFAWVVTIAMGHASANKEERSSSGVKCNYKFGQKKLFSTYDPEQNELIELPDRCFSMMRRLDCKNVIVKNMKRVFRLAGYGTYTPKKGSHYENLTSLFVDIIKNDNPNLTFKFVTQELKILTAKYGGFVAEITKSYDNQQKNGSNLQIRKDKSSRSSKSLFNRVSHESSDLFDGMFTRFTTEVDEEDIPKFDSRFNIEEFAKELDDEDLESTASFESHSHSSEYSLTYSESQPVETQRTIETINFIVEEDEPEHQNEKELPAKLHNNLFAETNDQKLEKPGKKNPLFIVRRKREQDKSLPSILPYKPKTERDFRLPLSAIKVRHSPDVKANRVQEKEMESNLELPEIHSKYRKQIAHSLYKEPCPQKRTSANKDTPSRLVLPLIEGTPKKAQASGIKPEGRNPIDFANKVFIARGMPNSSPFKNKNLVIKDPLAIKNLKAPFKII